MMMIWRVLLLAVALLASPAALALSDNCKDEPFYKFGLLGNNLACGVGALQLNQTGVNDTAFGYEALSQNQSGSNNLAAGYQAGGNVVSGNANTLLGAGCMASSSSVNNSLNICSGLISAISGNGVSGGVLRFIGESSVASDVPATTTTLANIAGLTATLEATKTYRFEAELHFDADATGGHKYAISGTATATAIKYQVTSVCNATNNLVISSRQTALAGSVGQAGCVSGYTKINGTMTSNAAGTLTVQFAQNAASGTSSVLRGSTFVVREVQ